MTRLKVAVIDDDEHALDELQRILSKKEQLNIIGKAKTALEGIQLIKENNPDIVFADVHMPGGNGFDMMEAIEGSKPGIIFMSAFSENLIPSFRFNPIGFLHKPIIEEDLIALLTYHQSKINSNGNSQSGIDTDRIGIPTSSGYEYLSIANIQCIVADGSYSKIIFNNGTKSLLVSKGIKEFERALLNKNIVRISRSVMVNLDKVIRYAHEAGGTLIMDDDNYFTIGKKYKNEVVDRLNMRNIQL